MAHPVLVEAGLQKNLSNSLKMYWKKPGVWWKLFLDNDLIDNVHNKNILFTSTLRAHPDFKKETYIFLISCVF